MSNYKVSQVNRLNERTLHLVLTPDSGADVIQFLPGQYCALSFETASKYTPTRCFSLVNSPNRTGVLEFAMRTEGAYTQTVADLTVGTPATVQGPFGSFTFQTNQYPNLVFVAGGIGITPLMSLMRYATEKGWRIPITLFYSAQNQDDLPFYEEIVALTNQNPNLTAHFFLDKASAGLPQGFQQGYITAEAIEQVVGSLEQKTFFICGPKVMIQSLRSQLIKKSVDEAQIKDELFGQGTRDTNPNNRATYATIYKLTAAALVVTGLLVWFRDVGNYLERHPLAASTDTTPATTSTTTPASAPTTTNVPATPSTSTPDNSTVPTTTTTPSVQTAAPVYTPTYYNPRSTLS